MQRRDSCLVGCGVAAVVALCSLLALAMVLKRGTGWVRERVQYYQAWQDLDRDWRPPSGDLDQGRGWPKSIRGYALALHDDEAALAQPQRLETQRANARRKAVAASAAAARATVKPPVNDMKP